MNYKYSQNFFDFIDKSSGRSASAFLNKINLGFTPLSVLDVGCGRGVWLKAWKELDIKFVLGLDGDYVDLNGLQIDKDEFLPTDISKPFSLRRKFDLVQCLEVAEHIPEDCADTLISNLTKHSDLVLFSAAPPGQGGENHINEQPLNYWAKKFYALGFSCFDYPRKVVQGITEIEPWYRYNTLLFANSEGQARLGQEVIAMIVEDGEKFKDYRSLGWKVRCWLIHMMPRKIVEILAILKHRFFSVLNL